MKTPLILLAGYLGSGKTTLLRHILSKSKKRIAVLMNEFGDVGIDTNIVRGENVMIKELLEGCVCCSLVGEFEAAVKEIVRKYKPELLIVETTGIAEADNLVLSVRDSLSLVDLKAVVTVVDADLLMRFPSLGRNIEMQIQAATLLVLNKTDLVTKKQLAAGVEKLHKINSHVPIIATKHSVVELDELLFSKGKKKAGKKESGKKEATPTHATSMQTFSLTTAKHTITKPKLESFLKKLPPSIVRCKGYVTIGRNLYLVNYVRKRWTIEPGKGTQKLVFIGENISKEKKKVEALLKAHFS